jgi:membrane associated rhomboid family serine protease
MSIYSRDYLRRDEGPRGRVVFWIIGITVAAYFVQGAFLGRGEIDLATIFGVVPEKLVGRGWLWQLVTHVLLHAPYGITHLAFNMLFSTGWASMWRRSTACAASCSSMWVER